MSNREADPVRLSQRSASPRAINLRAAVGRALRFEELTPEQFRRAAAGYLPAAAADDMLRYEYVARCIHARFGNKRISAPTELVRSGGLVLCARQSESPSRTSAP